ncbi:MAG: CRISPR-associated endonuclease Cas2 [Candidatus Korarchaeota archaeon]|nr:CRISPR-associated endonuclease Cas2 [Candidatus Korarchaeota archaeon]
MTHYLVVYDISDDAVRLKVANKLKDYGMRRIQYSAFVGELAPRRYRSLVGELRRIISGVREGRRMIHLFPIPVSSLERVEVVGEWEPKEGGRVEVV